MTQLSARGHVAEGANDGPEGLWSMLRMARPTRIHAGKNPRRIHFIEEWAELRGLRQADIVRKLGVDKATVSRWFGGALPQEASLFKLAALIEGEKDREPDDVTFLFRDPMDDWLARFFRDRADVDRERVRQALEALFPKKVA